MSPVLGSGNDEQRKAGRALNKAGVESNAMVGLWCAECGGEDGAHVPQSKCEGVN